jgi:hypothetical protein
MLTTIRGIAAGARIAYAIRNWGGIVARMDRRALTRTRQHGIEPWTGR